ncbi:expressed unknown protein [Seminavis robusta]|uniref:Uncharacterized protein n=1 Tax=Seminavis robusta TaxID=568900 RepID=A0A9N8EJW1_9STRA|nr:expressed unknown protein [Seminavis robusta]|eukprot:Sro1223_g253890.1 n/a (221) ;mRNA; r:11515-12177
MSQRQKGKLNERLMVDFHVQSGGGWFWKRDRENVVRMTVDDLICGNTTTLTKHIGYIVEASKDPRQREREQAKNLDLVGFVDMEKLKTDDSYAVEILELVETCDSKITLDVMRKVIISVGGVRKLSTDPSEEDRVIVDKAVFKRWCRAHHPLRPVYFKGVDFLVHFAARLRPKCCLDGEKKCEITWIIIIFIIIRHLEKHPDATLLDESTSLNDKRQRLI